MCKLLVLCGVFLCLSLTAAAQDSTAAFDTTSPASETAAPISLHPSGRDPWQIGAGFQYQRFNVFDLGFNNFGFDSQVTRYFTDRFGVEGAIQLGFGQLSNVPANLCNCAKSLFLGGGPHVVWPNKRRFEPWAHALFGLEHFRFAQTATIGSNTAFGFTLGGGVDYKIGGRMLWRFQGDYIGSTFSSTVQNNYSFGSGIVFNF
jgi:opacity protein-like surface antigen